MKRALVTDNDVTEGPENLSSSKRYATFQSFNVVEGVAEIKISDSCNPSTGTVLGNDATENCSLVEEITGSVNESEDCGELNLIVEEDDLPQNAELIPEEYGAGEPGVPETTTEPPGELKFASGDDNGDPARRTFTQLTTKPLSTLPQPYVFLKSKEIKKTIIVHKPAKRNLGGPENLIVPTKTMTETECCIIQTLLRRQFTQKSWKEIDRIAIFRNGPPQPSIERIGSSEYKKFPWLAGCAFENKFYCWYCLLYSSIGVWSTSALIGAFIQIASEHSSTDAHVDAEMLLKQWTLKAGILRDDETESSCSGTKRKKKLQIQFTSETTIAQASGKSTCLIVQLIEKSFTLGNWTEEERKKIIQQGRPTPKLKLLIPDTKQRKIKHDYENVPWLTGSEEMGKLFCWPCVLFCKGPWSKVGYENTNFIHRHGLSQPHLVACLRLKVWERQVKRRAVVQKLSQQQHNETVRKSHEFMRYVIDVICYFKKKTTHTDVSFGDFMKVIKKISRHDAKLKHYLRVRTFSEDEISGIVKSVEACLKSRIIKEANNANFVVLMLNRVCNKPRLSVVLRYVNKNGEVIERFLQFIEYKYDRSVNNILQKVLGVIGFLDYETKLVGFTHDDSAFMPSDLAFFSSKMTENHPTASFFHYSDHNLKTLVLHSLSQMDQCRTFIYQIQDLVKFFEQNSIAKTSLTIIDLEISGNEENSDYVWDFSSGLIKTINDHYPAMVKLFERVIRSAVAWNTETVAQAQNFVRFLKPLENRFLIATFSRIFQDINELTRVMETDFNVNNWKKIAEKTTEAVIKTRCEDFEEIFQSALNMLQSDLEFAYDLAYAEKFDIIMESISIFIHGRTKDLDKWSYMELATKPAIYEPGKSSQFNRYVRGLQSDFPNSGFDKLSAQLSFFKGNALINGKTVDELIKYIHDLDMIPALSSLHTFAQLLLTAPLYPISSPKTPTIKKIAAYVNNHENITSTDTLMYVEKDLLAELQNEPGFYGDVIAHYVKNSAEEHLQFRNNTEAP